MASVQALAELGLKIDPIGELAGIEPSVSLLVCICGDRLVGQIPVGRVDIAGDLNEVARIGRLNEAEADKDAVVSRVQETRGQQKKSNRKSQPGCELPERPRIARIPRIKEN